MKEERSPGSQLIDSMGRQIDYLRISVTDRCNLRCTYCNPGQDCAGGEGDVLGDSDIDRLVRVAASLGFTKVRLTGGEPTLRDGLAELVYSISRHSVSEFVMTTNGTMLAPIAGALRRAGLRRINISIDSLDRSRYARVTGNDCLDKVLQGLDASLQAGFETKVNVVALEDLMFDEALSFCRMADERGIGVRFIEFMPLCGEDWQPEKCIPLDGLEQRLTSFLDCELEGRDGVARVYRCGDGKIGFIRSVTDPFCSECNRLRVAADGTIRPCLLSQQQFDLIPLLREGACDEDIGRLFAKAAAAKPSGHTLCRTETIRAGSHPLARVIGG